ncbi:nagb/rpia/CoA transferase-like protein [Thozetella sp. PMI_491]|nr:nagb/rpia/CoA transferase-like protein [Thozetella sp. PMI_491]
MDEPAPPQHITKRTVVSSFIFKLADGGPKVALFRRSARVRTYQHHLAPISGSVDKEDASPLAAAWRELKEETTLTQSSLALVRQGKSYSFVDSDVGREWTIFPFMFRLKTAEEGGAGEQGIQIDWEHESWAWYDPFQVEDSEAFGGVPRLAQSLRRVFFELDIGAAAGEVLSAGLERLQHDYQSGARQLAGIALQLFRDVVKKVELGDSSVGWWASIRSVVWHIWKNGRESMGAAIMVAMLSVLQQVDRRRESLSALPHDTQWKEAVLEDLDGIIAQRGAEAAGRVSAAFAEYLEEAFSGKRASGQPLAVLTLSESSTIALGIRHLLTVSGFSLDLRVLESRPLFEGVTFTASLVEEIAATDAASRLSVTLYADAAAGLAAQGVDVVVVGADRVAQSGAVSNKTGSLPAILCARQAATLGGGAIKVVVLTETEKVAPPGNAAQHVIEENDPEQLVQTWRGQECGERVRRAAASVWRHKALASARNVSFEWCPADQIDIYITEHGPWTAEDVGRRSALVGEEQERLFGDL